MQKNRASHSEESRESSINFKLSEFYEGKENEMLHKIHLSLYIYGIKTVKSQIFLFTLYSNWYFMNVI